jgi:hypothetical protein
MATTTMLNLPVATSLSGSESFWILQGGTDKRTTVAEAFSVGGFPSSALSPIAGLTLLANNSTIAAGPTAQTLTQTFDANYGTTQNAFITRSSTGWIIRALVGNDLPNPTTASLGGVTVSTNPTNQWMTGITASGSASYSTISASQLVQGITGSTGSAVVLSSSPRLYNPVIDGGGFILTSSAAGSLTNRALVGNVGGYNVLFDQAGNLGLQMGSSILGDDSVYMKKNNGFRVTSNDAGFIYFMVSSRSVTLGGGGSSLVNTIFTVSSNTDSSANFPAGTYTVVGSTSTGVKYQVLRGQTGGLPAYFYPSGYTLDPISINMASTADNAISVTLPSTTTRWQVRGLFLFNNSTVISTAVTGGFYTGPGGTGTVVVSTTTTYGMASTAPFAVGSMVVVSPSNINTAIWGSSVTTIYMALTTPSSVPATVALRVSVELFG